MDDFIKAINDIRSGIDYGMVNMTLKIHDKDIATIEATKATNYKTKDNVEAMAMISAILKGAALSGENCAITTTVVMENGVAKRLQVQDIKKITLK